MNENKNVARFSTIEDSLRQSEELTEILGYPSLRTVRDRENNVILEVGDLITYKAVERAKQAGVFEQLLSAVYRQNCQETKGK